jgi:pilus assembly protein CpaE
MSTLSVVILCADNEQRSLLQMLVDGTAIAQTAYSFASFPVTGTDLIVRRIQDVTSDVVLVDVPPDNPGVAVHAIELLHAEVPSSAIVAVGDMRQPQTIVNAMRAGAKEFLDRPPNATALLEAFARFASTRRKRTGEKERGKVLLVMNAKGGCGATTVAVNTATALQESYGRVALVDLAPIGHAALHLNLKPPFGVTDCIRNLHRLDTSLLEGYMTRCAGGLHLLAGTDEPLTAEPSSSEFARLFDLLSTQYKYVVVDASSRLDRVTRVVCDLSHTSLLVAQADVTALWSAAKVRTYLGEGVSRERLRLVLNRFRKIPGFSEADTEAATGIKIAWKIPNQFHSISVSIDRGAPVVQQNNSDIARSFAGLAALLAEGDDAGRRRPWGLFKTV